MTPKQRKEEERQKNLMIESFKKLALDDSGRRFINLLLAETGVLHRCSFDREAPDAMAFMEGQRSIGLKVLSLFDTMPDVYIKFLEANLNDKKINEQIKSNNKDEGEDDDETD